VYGLPGDPLPYAPDWSTSLDGEYDWPAFGTYKGFVGATWSYVGSRSSDFASDVTATGQVTLPSYNTFGLRLGLENSRYRVAFWVKNLGDSRGITSYESESAPGPNGVATYIVPRTFGVTLSAALN
jgi:iron complex outermembrane receptor protein